MLVSENFRLADFAVPVTSLIHPTPLPLCHATMRHWAYQQSYSTSGLISTGMGDHLQRANHLSISPSYLGQLSLLPSVGQEMSTSQKCGGAPRLWSKGRHGSFHLWINVSVAGKLCGSSLTRAIPEHLEMSSS